METNESPVLEWMVDFLYHKRHGNDLISCLLFRTRNLPKTIHKGE